MSTINPLCGGAVEEHFVGVLQSAEPEVDLQEAQRLVRIAFGGEMCEVTLCQRPSRLAADCLVAQTCDISDCGLSDNGKTRCGDEFSIMNGCPFAKE